MLSIAFVVDLMLTYSVFRYLSGTQDFLPRFPIPFPGRGTPRFPIPVPLLGGERGGFRFPIPDSRFPIPYFLFPIPYSLFPVPRSAVPCSLSIANSLRI
ncbi:hypothetical protein [Moorena producens]|uniref:hypothetical protein n=1 Tax=Moorena producens TaxID=1155739 RepID=UPI003C7161DF